MILNVSSNISRIKSLIVNKKQDKISEKTAIARTKQQIYEEIRIKMKENLQNALDPTSNMSDDEKANYEMKINQKIKNGEKISQSEMQYIRIKSPYMYAMISRVQFQRQMYEEKLKNCRSKEEVEDAYNSSISHIDKDDPAKEPLLAAYTNVTLKFKKSNEYKRLPQKTEDKEEKGKEHKKKKYSNSEYLITYEYKSEGIYYHKDKYTSVDMKA